jgi:uncharacterized protein
MKFLLLVAVVGVVLWLLRSRSGAGPSSPGKTRAADAAQPMVSCAHCGVHLPRAEAVHGAQASYCSEAHQIAHGEQR